MSHRVRVVLRSLWIGSCVVLLATVGRAGESPFALEFGARGITSLKRQEDLFGTEFLRPNATLGDVVLRFRLGEGDWQTAATSDREAEKTDGVADPFAWRWRYSILGDGGARLALVVGFDPVGDALRWTIAIRNEGGTPIEIGDLELPLPMNTRYSRDEVETMTKRVFQHSFVAGHGSHIYWTRPSGTGALLLMTPRGGTALEYFTSVGTDYAWGGANFSAFVHSAASGAAETRGTWRQEHTSVRLDGAGGARDAVEYAFDLRWAAHLEDLREWLVAGGGVDVHVVPGMVVPEDLTARFSLRTRHAVHEIVPEHPADTTLVYLGERGRDTHVWEVRFARLGENLLTVRYGDGRVLPLEFFATEPLETLIHKRAAFIASKQQHRDPSKWYNGLFSLWDMRTKTLLGPDNLGGQHPYAVSGSDDPSNSKCAFLSEKNVVYPDPAEIEALEYHLENFVWGKLQRTDREHPFPYALYGCDSWHQCRNSEVGLGSGGHGQERMWRTFDYTTYILVYFNMYRIAKQNPELVRYLDADGYLERAFGTARAYFVVPYSIDMRGWDFAGWCDWAYKVGNFHERYLVPLIAALEEEGYAHWAAEIRGEWEKKVKYFLYDAEYPFSSEMPFDSTAYESSHAIARYALTHTLKPDRKLWQDKKTGKWYSHPEIEKADALRYLERQMAANIACRGWLETAYYHLGSDFRGLGSTRYTLSYMSQMGGWAVLDYALEEGAPHDSDDVALYARLGYASLLSSWALVNSGPEDSGYGYWYPGSENDGAVGWAFQPVKFGGTWNPSIREMGRGIWPVCGEIDHGLTGGVHAAATVVVDDPVFGLFPYGGTLERQDGEFRVVPRDGVRQRFWIIRGKHRISAEITGGGFARGEPIVIGEGWRSFRVAVEARGRRPGSASLQLEGIPGGVFVAAVDGGMKMRGYTDDSLRLTIDVPVYPARPTLVQVLTRKP